MSELNSKNIVIAPKDVIKFATNNLSKILADQNGAYCYYCFGKPQITIKSETCDKSTVICNLCGIDSVVPASIYIAIIAISISTDPKRVYKKNLNEAYILLAPPHIPMIKNIGIKPASKKR